MVIWVSVAVFLAVCVGFVVFDTLVLGGVSDFYTKFDTIMAVVTVFLLCAWAYVLCEGLGVI